MRRLGTIPAAILGVAFLTLTACGGGGGGAVNNPPSNNPPPAPPAPDPFDTAEFRENWGLDAIGALKAYNDGHTGDGITIAVIDSGIDPDHPDLDGNLSAASTDIIGGRGVLQGSSEHGTLVASIAAAEKNDIGIHGVAFDANILAIRADDPGSCDTDCDFFDSDLATAVDYAVANGADIINLSLSGDGPNSATLDTALDNAVAAGVIIVQAAGNDGNPNPSDSTGYALSAGAGGQAVIVGAVDRLRNIATFSNRAGNSRSVFLVAPGDDLIATGFDGDLFIVGGTSFSTPIVSGAIAIMMQAFPSLTAQEIVEILLDTAVDLGLPGVDAVYGAGLINLAAALAPQGILSLATFGGIEISPALDVTQSTLSFGAAFGDSVTSRADVFGALGAALVSDQYDRTYMVNLATNVALKADTRFSLAGLTRDSVYRRHHDLQMPGLGRLEFAYTDEWGALSEAQLYPNRLSDDQKRVSNVSFRYRQALSETTDVTFAHGYSAANTVSQPILGETAGVDFKSTDKGAGAFLGFTSGGTNVGLEHLLSQKTTLSVNVATGTIETGTIGERDNTGSRSRQVAAAQLTHQVTQNFRAGLLLGVMSEQGAILDTVAHGAFDGIDSATTRFATLSAAIDAKDWTFIVQASRGLTSVKERPGMLLHGFSDLQSSSYRISSYWRTPYSGHVLGFAISQPLRVESGSATVDIPTGRNLSSEVFSFDSYSLDFTPDAREIDFELSHAFYGSTGFTAQTNVIYQMNPTHSTSKRAAISIIAEVKSKF